MLYKPAFLNKVKEILPTDAKINFRTNSSSYGKIKKQIKYL